MSKFEKWVLGWCYILDGLKYILTFGIYDKKQNTASSYKYIVKLVKNQCNKDQI